MREQREQEQELGKTTKAFASLTNQPQEPELTGESTMTTQTQDAATGSAARDASRELDALVAEKVMGWRWLPYWSANVETRGLFPPRDSDLGFDDHDCYPAYSTNIAAAWLVVEKLAEQDADTIVTRLAPGNGAEVTIWRKNPYRPSCEAADTAPLAICRAALLAVGAA